MTALLGLLTAIAFQSHSGLYATHEDIQRGVRNVQSCDWAKKLFEPIRANADRWAAKSAQELRALVPPPGSSFAYGFAGCPECNANWEWWGYGGVASLDTPRTVTCPSCKRVYPDSEHPDTGEGWERPFDGKMFYFVGVYNAYAAKQITRALQDLAYSYALTGDRKYSRAAAALFDRLADTYPSSPIGARDYPYNSDTESVGRLEAPIYIACRSFVMYADQFDLLCESPDFAEASASGTGSIRQHVEESIIRDGGRFSHEWMLKARGMLSNAGPDYMRATLAAGILLGDARWVRDALSSPYTPDYFLANFIDRDGQNYQTSLGYASHGIRVCVEIAEMLYNYRSAEYPNGINHYTNPKLQKAMFWSGVDTDCVGHAPRIGNWLPDFSVVADRRIFSLYPYIYSEVLTSRAWDDEARGKCESLREAAAPKPVEELRSLQLADNWNYWMLLHAQPLPNPGPKRQDLPQRSLLGGKGLAILRSGDAPDGRAALVRYGTTTSQAHLDSLGLGFYGLGRELTYDLGFLLGSSHVQFGWARATASHNLVVVNEQNQMAEPCAGGSAHFYVETAAVRAFEASDPSCYSSEEIRDYRRTIALVDIPGGASYLVDVFRVDGGRRHDLTWHFSGKLADVQGATLGPVQEKGSLAGEDIDWGRKVGAGGDIIGCGDKPPYWNPPPGNGYGFLYDVRCASHTGEHVTATWVFGSETRHSVKLHLLPEAGSRLVTACAPGIVPEYPKAEFAVLRREGRSLRSAFVSVAEAVDGESGILSVRRMICSGNPGAVGVEVVHKGGSDYVVSSLTPAHAVFRAVSGEQITFSGRFGFLRIQDGSVKRAILVGGTELAFGNHRITSPVADYSGSITKISSDGSEVELDQPIPPQLAGSMVYFTRDGYSHNSPYRIIHVSSDRKTIKLDGDAVIGRGIVGDTKPASPDAIANLAHLKRSIDLLSRPTGYFRGKLLTNDRTGESTNIVNVEADQLTIHADDARVVVPRDTFTIWDLQPGDRFSIPVAVVR